jgi:septal ring factor EnvC (AmiA/AmiB activator)
MSGYTKEKADKLIKKHEDKAAQHQKDADDLKETGGTHPGKNAEVAELERAAKAERDKADNQRALKKHWGD